MQKVIFQTSNDFCHLFKTKNTYAILLYGYIEMNEMIRVSDYQFMYRLSTFFAHYSLLNITQLYIKWTFISNIDFFLMIVSAYAFTHVFYKVLNITKY